MDNTDFVLGETVSISGLLVKTYLSQNVINIHEKGRGREKESERENKNKTGKYIYGGIEKMQA